MSIAVQHRRDSRANCEAATPLDGELWFDQTLKTFRAGDGAMLGGHLLKKWGKSYLISPAVLSADQNDYNPTDLAIAETVFISLNANVSITGLAGGTANREISIFNNSAYRLTLVDASTSSSAANRFSFGGNIVLRSGQGARLFYVAAQFRWFVLGRADLGVTILPEDVNLPGGIAPSQITANQNDYTPSGLSAASRLRLSTDASRDITGITGGANGRVLILVNTGTNPIVLKDASVSSTAANRFDFGGDITLSAKNAAIIQYDATDSRWKLIASTAGAAVADGAVTAPKLAAAAAGGNIINGKLVYSVAGSALTVAVKNLAGNDPSAGDPVWVRVRDTTASTDAADWMKLTAALSVVLSSGSSAGSSNSTPFRLWIVLFNDGATPRLGIINCVSGSDIMSLAGWGIAGSTAEGGAGAADSAHTFYTGTAVAAKPYAILGYATWETGLAAAGTWSAGPTRAQMFGAGVPTPGTMLQNYVSRDGAVATTTTIMPIDDTIPQNTEGAQFMSRAITPQSAANVLDIYHLGNYAISVNQYLVYGIFQDAAADALAAWTHVCQVSSDIFVVSGRFTKLAGLTAATTFKLRAGPGGAATVTFNGFSSARKLGGAIGSMLQVTEYMG